MASRTHRPTDAELVHWDDRRDGERLQRNLEALLRVLKVEEGKVVSHEIFQLDAIFHILSSMLILQGVETDEVKNRLLRVSCFRLPLLKTHTLATFRRVLASHVRRHLTRPQEIFRIIFPLNIDGRCLSGRKSLQVKDLVFQVRTWRELEQSLSIIDWFRHSQPVAKFDKKVLRRHFTPLEVVVTGRDHSEAFGKAYSGFELLQCVLNLEAFHRYTIQGGRPKPLGKIRLPPVYGAFREDGTFDIFYYEAEPASEYDAHRVSDDVLSGADRLMREFGKADADANTTVGLVEDAIRRYGRALNTTNWREAFLSLWQVLESLTHAPNGRYTIEGVCRRVKILLRGSPLLSDLLETCYQTRSGLVHVGRFPDEGLHDVSMLKAVVESCINGVYALRRRCPDRERLFLYYQTATASDHDLAIRAKIIASVQRERKT